MDNKKGNLTKMETLTCGILQASFTLKNHIHTTKTFMCLKKKIMC